MREEGVQEAARGGGRRGVRAREGEVDGRSAAALAEEFVEGLAQEFGDAGLRRGQDEEALLPRLRRGERGYLARLFAAPDEDFGRRAREYPSGLRSPDGHLASVILYLNSSKPGLATAGTEAQRKAEVRQVELAAVCLLPSAFF